LCPDGPLWDVPFQALLTPLPSPSGKTTPTSASKRVFLWERFSLAYGYSATGARAALDARQRPDRTRPSQTMLVLANPDFGKNAPAGSGLRSEGNAVDGSPQSDLFTRAGGLGALPYTRMEANAILSCFPEATLKMGSDAQEVFLKQR